MGCRRVYVSTSQNPFFSCFHVVLKTWWLESLPTFSWTVSLLHCPYCEWLGLHSHRSCQEPGLGGRGGGSVSAAHGCPDGSPLHRLPREPLRSPDAGLGDALLLPGAFLVSPMALPRDSLLAIMRALLFPAMTDAYLLLCDSSPEWYHTNLGALGRLTSHFHLEFIGLPCRLFLSKYSPWGFFVLLAKYSDAWAFREIQKCGTAATVPGILPLSSNNLENARHCLSPRVS